MIRRHRRPQQDTDLDITAFMNLMIVLVPILLMNMIFAHTSIIELNFPKGEAAAELDPKRVDLRVAIYDRNIDVLEGETTIVKRIAFETEGFDFELLSRTMQELKKRLPEKRDITVMALPETPYQTIVSVMDSVSSYTTVVAGSAVEAELFPDIGITDTPSQSVQGG